MYMCTVLRSYKVPRCVYTMQLQKYLHVYYTTQLQKYLLVYCTIYVVTKVPTCVLYYVVTKVPTSVLYYVVTKVPTCVYYTMQRQKSEEERLRLQKFAKNQKIKIFKIRLLEDLRIDPQYVYTMFYSDLNKTVGGVVF